MKQRVDSDHESSLQFQTAYGYPSETAFRCNAVRFRCLRGRGVCEDGQSSPFTVIANLSPASKAIGGVK